jgi:hypothetical protein
VVISVRGMAAFGFPVDETNMPSVEVRYIGSIFGIVIFVVLCVLKDPQRPDGISCDCTELDRMRPSKVNIITSTSQSALDAFLAFRLA